MYEPIVIKEKHHTSQPQDQKPDQHTEKSNEHMTKYFVKNDQAYLKKELNGFLENEN